MSDFSMVVCVLIIVRLVLVTWWASRSSVRALVGVMLAMRMRPLRRGCPMVRLISVGCVWMGVDCLTAFEVFVYGVAVVFESC